jgi:hypothetical protein
MSKPMTFWERVAAGAAGSLLGAFIGTLFFPGPGTALGAKIGAILGGGGDGGG